MSIGKKTLAILSVSMLALGIASPISSSFIVQAQTKTTEKITNSKVKSIKDLVANGKQGIQPGEFVITYKSTSSTANLEKSKAALEKLLQNKGLQNKVKSVNAVNSLQKAKSIIPNSETSSKALETLQKTVVVKFDVQENEITEAAQKLEKIKERFNPNYQTTAGEESQKIKAILEKDPSIASVSYSSRKQVNLTPDDTHYSKMWSLNNTAQAYPSVDSNTAVMGSNSGTAGADIKAESGWDKDTTSGGTGVVAGISDTGVDITHPDLENNIWVNQGEIPTAIKSTLDTDSSGKVSSKEILKYFRDNNFDKNLDGKVNLLDALAGGSPLIDSLDNDNNSYKNDLFGWNFAENNNDVMDGYGHGTHVAGTVAASGNNTLGVTGVAYNATILPIKISNSDGYFADDVGIASSILYGGMNANTMNMSWGGTSFYDLANDPLYIALTAAVNNGLIPVAAAGNSSSDVELSMDVPASYDNVITVSASDSKDLATDFTSFGPKVDVIAPGRDILSTLPVGNSLYRTYIPEVVYDSIYAVLDGTSMAAPHVTGLSALIKANHSSFNLNDVRQILRTRSQDLSNKGFSDTFGFGRIDMSSALDNSINDHLPVVKFTNIKNYDKPTGTLAINGEVSGANATNWTLDYRTINANSWTTITTGTPKNGNLNNLDTSTLNDGVYYIRLSSGSGSLKGVDIRKVIIGNPGQFVVNSTADSADQNIGDGKCETSVSNECTLRAAIAESNTINSADIPEGKTITFAIPTTDPNYSAGSKSWLISPTTALPAITSSVGLTTVKQPVPIPPTPVEYQNIEISGNNLSSGDGLTIDGKSIFVTGLTINQFPDNGVNFTPNAEYSLVEKVNIGTGVDGTTAKANQKNGVLATGGTSPIAVTHSNVSNNKLGGIIIKDKLTNGFLNYSFIDNTKVENNLENGMEFDNLTNFFGYTNTIKNSKTGLKVHNNSDSISLYGSDISGNQQNGITVISGNNLSFSGNDIYNNGGLGIDLGNDGVTQNDTGDTDLGAAKLTNFPVIHRTELVGNQLIVSGYVKADNDVSISLSDKDASGFGEGKHIESFYEGTSDKDFNSGTGSYNIPNVGQDSNVNKFEFRINLPGVDKDGNPINVTANDKVTAIAGYYDGVSYNTSEYSPQSTPSVCNLFSDTPSSYPFTPHICRLRSKGIISGYGDGTFRPEISLSREAMAKFTRNAFLGTSYTNTSCGDFEDVKPANSNSPYANIFYDEITTLKCEGIISGYLIDGKSYFKPKENVTRSQAMKFVILGVRKMKNDPNYLTPSVSCTKSFTDLSNTHPLKDYVMAAACGGIISGYDMGQGNYEFRPDTDVTRGAMSKMVSNTLDLVEW